MLFFKILNYIDIIVSEIFTAIAVATVLVAVCILLLPFVVIFIFLIPFIFIGIGVAIIIKRIKTFNSFYKNTFDYYQ